MKNFLLWLLVLHVVFQAYIAIEIIPEFHVLSHDDFLKELKVNSMSDNPPPGIGNLEFNEYFNGRRGKYLANSILTTDMVMLLLLVIVMKISRSENPSAAPKIEDDKNRNVETAS